MVRKSVVISLGGVVGVALLIILGYTVFRVFAVELVPNPALIGFLLFAVVGAVASFFSPCSFPLLPGYLTHYAEVAGSANRNRRAFAGLVAALGVFTFTLLLAVGIASLGSAVTGSLSVAGTGGLPIRIFRGIVGLLLIILGVSHFRPSSLNFHRLSFLGHRLVSPDNPNPWRGLYLYGFGYQAVGIGCSGPFLTGVIIFALAAGGFGAALAGFTLYTITITTLMLFVSLLTGFTAGRIVRGLTRAAPKIKKASGAVQVVAGIFLLFSSIFVDVFLRILFP